MKIVLKKFFIKETFSVDIEIVAGFLEGGIDINPIRSTQKNYFLKTFRI